MTYMVQMSFKIFRSHFDEDEQSEDQEYMTAMDQYTLMQDFAKDALCHDTITTEDDTQVVYIDRPYSPSKQSPTERIFAHGARHSGLCLQRLWGKPRALLTRDITYDFDMKNAHPTIALYLAHKHFPGQDWWKPLRKYVSNREDLFDKTRNHVKGVDLKVEVLRAMNSE